MKPLYDLFCLVISAMNESGYSYHRLRLLFRRVNHSDLFQLYVQIKLLKTADRKNAYDR